MPGSTRSYEMAIRLAKRGHEVHVLTSKRDSKIFSRKWKVEKKQGIYVHWLSIPYDNKMSYYRRLLSFIYFAYYTSKKGISLGADLVFATSTPLTIALPAVRIKNKLKTKMVFEVRDLWPEIPISIGIIKNPIMKYISKKLELFAYKNSSKIIGLSSGMCQGVINTGYNKNNVYCIPNSCDIDFFQNVKVDEKNIEKYFFLEPKDLLVIYTGTLGQINGVEYLVDIAKKVYEKDKNIKFLIVGDGKMRNKIIARAKKNKCYEKNLFFIKQVPKEKIPYIFQLASISTSLFLPIKEMENNSANKFFDSLAAGVPIAINYGGWQLDMIRDFDIGLKLNIDPEEAAKELVALINDREMLAKMSKNALELAKVNFSRDKLANEFISILESA